MTIRDRIPVFNRLAGYEQATVSGILLIFVGSLMNWLTVDATESAADEVGDLQAGITGFTGVDLGWGAVTLGLGAIAACCLALVLWRYSVAGRITGLVLLLLGLASAGIAVIGLVLTGALYAPADRVSGISVEIGVGIFLTLVGSVLLLSGGILRVAAGAPGSENSDTA